MNSKQAAVAVAFKSGVGVGVLVGVAAIASVGVSVYWGGNVNMGKGVSVGVPTGHLLIHVYEKYPKNMDRTIRKRIIRMSILTVHFNERISSIEP